MNAVANRGNVESQTIKQLLQNDYISMCGTEKSVDECLLYKIVCTSKDWLGDVRRHGYT